MAELREMSDRDLAEYKAGYKPSTQEYVLADMEIQRRFARPAAIRSWIAIGISVFALVVSVVALFIKS
ncbi:MAG: hypothetical protein ACREVR_15010 [Burkholderiales bacterium]